MSACPEIRATAQTLYVCDLPEHHTGHCKLIPVKGEYV